MEYLFPIVVTDWAPANDAINNANSLLNPDFKQLITMDDKQYGSIGCYVYAKFLDWISPDLYYEIFTNPKSASKSEKYRKSLLNKKKCT